MASSVYLTSAEGRSGKSAIALGILETLLAEAPTVGIFRPLIRAEEAPDRVLSLLLEHAGSTIPYERCVGVTYVEANDDPDAAITEIVERYKALEAECDAVLVVGSDYTDVAVPTELSFNARIAANLGTPVVLALGGRIRTDAQESLGQLPPRSAAHLAQLAELAAHELSAAHASLLAAIVNRADPEHLDDITQAVARVLPDDTPVWALPEDRLLVAPPVSAVVSAVDGELIRGSADLLPREVLGLIIAGMSMEHTLPRLTEGAAIIIAADRSETLLAVTVAHGAESFPTLSAVILNGDFPLSPEVTRLLDGLGSSLPVVRTSLGTFETAQRVMATSGKLSPESPRKFDTALALFREHVDGANLRSRLELHDSGARTPTMFSYELFERALRSGAHIVLPEGSDDRVLRAASTVLTRGIARITLLGDESEVRQRGAELGLALDDAHVVDPATSPWRDTFAAEYQKLRAHRGMTLEEAHARMADVSYFGTMMVHTGRCDGMVSGAAHTTAHTITPSFEIIKTKPGVEVVSSVFFMALDDRVLVYGDCAVVPDPTAEQLADIAISSAATAADFGIDPRVAMLSYSTGASGAGADVERVRRATELAQQRAPELMLDGPMQYDAASDPAVGHLKMPESSVAGRATVFIFPDLNTGNNTYKAVQRVAGAIAVGPVLQGLNKPVNDLSRGASVDDIVSTIAITAVQAGAAANTAADTATDTEAGTAASTTANTKAGATS